MKCPYCGYEDDLDKFKKLRDPWRFRFYEVYRLECPKCRGIFNYYIGVSPKGKRSEFVIKVRMKKE